MFDNPFSMVVAIVAITMFASVMRAKYGYDRKGRHSRHGVSDPVEADAMRDEIRSLKERIAVLERVITDTNSTAALEREIEKLR